MSTAPDRFLTTPRSRRIRYAIIGICFLALVLLCGEAFHPNAQQSSRSSATQSSSAGAGTAGFQPRSAPPTSGSATTVGVPSGKAFVPVVQIPAPGTGQPAASGQPPIQAPGQAPAPGSGQPSESAPTPPPAPAPTQPPALAPTQPPAPAPTQPPKPAPTQPPAPAPTQPPALGVLAVSPGAGALICPSGLLGQTLNVPLIISNIGAGPISSWSATLSGGGTVHGGSLAAGNSVLVSIGDSSTNTSPTVTVTAANAAPASLTLHCIG